MSNSEENRVAAALKQLEKSKLSSVPPRRGYSTTYVNERIIKRYVQHVSKVEK